MEQWVQSSLTDCLGFPVPDEMFKLIETLSTQSEIDSYFKTLLDFSVPQHRHFVEEFKKRVQSQQKSTKNQSNKPNQPNKNKENLNQSAQKSRNKQSGKQTNAKIAEMNTKPNNQKAEPEIVNTSTGTKKKTKYVNLYGQDGTMNDVVMLKGRHLCNCQAAKHKLVNNCTRCGRIVCEQEGSGPCLFCGNLVCTEDELRVIESASKKGENLKNSLLQQERPKGWEEALAMRNRLLDYDRMSEKRTTVIDDESDYFRTNSVWLSDEERAKLKKIEEKMKDKKFASRRDQKITIDFGGRQIIEEPKISTKFEDEVLKEIADTFKHSSQTHNSQAKCQTKWAHSDDCDPNLTDIPSPIFDESVTQRFDINGPKFDGVYNRVQDKELLEVSDMKKCISMHQPWASLLVAGIKRHEGRSWYSSHRGRLWIAATAKPVDPDDITAMEKFYKLYYNDGAIECPKQYPSACLLGCVLVQECLPQEEYRSVYPKGESDSPYVFICSSPQELPVKFPIKGAHKIYKLDDSIHVAAVKALQRLAKINSEK